MKTYTIQEINEVLGGELTGSVDQQISGPEELSRAEKHHITFVGHRKFIKHWDDSKACAAVVNENFKIEAGEGRALIKVKNADLAMAKILEMFQPDAPVFAEDIHPTASVDASAQIGKNEKIGSSRDLRFPKLKSWISKMIILKPEDKCPWLEMK